MSINGDECIHCGDEAFDDCEICGLPVCIDCSAVGVSGVHCVVSCKGGCRLPFARGQRGRMAAWMVRVTIVEVYFDEQESCRDQLMTAVVPLGASAKEAALAAEATAYTEFEIGDHVSFIRVTAGEPERLSDYIPRGVAPSGPGR